MMILAKGEVSKESQGDSKMVQDQVVTVDQTKGKGSNRKTSSHSRMDTEESRRGH
jgi:hypothetical protein